jgi:predicted HicB family RNase H-like nuclease
MTKKRGGQPKPAERRKGRYLQIRVTESEKEGFDVAAELAGISLAAWVRERLRLAAREELGGGGRQVPFLESK